MTQITIDSAVRKIMHTCDGPVTPFVAIARACRLAVSSGDADVAANALDIALRDLGVQGLDTNGLASSE